MIQPTAVLVPVHHRPQNAAPFMRSLRASAQPAKVYVIANPSDRDTVAAWRQADAHMVIEADVLTFAEKINVGYQFTDERWVFLAGDDVRFHEAWLEAAQSVPGLVIGTNDLGNPRVMRGEHATHLLIARSYIDAQGASWDGPGVVCHEGYQHCFVDDEMVTVAKQRGVWGMALDSVVEHLHPLWEKSEMDDTYRLGQRFFNEDRDKFLKRVKRYGTV